MKANISVAGDARLERDVGKLDNDVGNTFGAYPSACSRQHRGLRPLNVHLDYVGVLTCHWREEQDVGQRECVHLVYAVHAFPLLESVVGVD